MRRLGASLETEVFLANVSRSMAELYSIALSLPAVERIQQAQLRLPPNR